MADVLDKQYKELVNKVKLDEYSSDELEEFGRKLSSIVVNTIGLVRYHKSKIVYYDITSTLLGNLTDEVQELIKGITFNLSKEEYINHIEELLKIINEMEISVNSNSVKRSLKKMVAEELRDMNRMSNQRKYSVW